MPGADLVWWRTTCGMRTVVSLLWDALAEPTGPDYQLEATLLDASGLQRAHWRTALAADMPTVFDSRAEGPWRGFDGEDGILALAIRAGTAGGTEAAPSNRRALPLVDWQLPDGRLTTLHSDQVIRAQAVAQRFTEIVVTEPEAGGNAIVLLNGEVEQPAGCLEVAVINGAGERRLAWYAKPMQPFTVHRIGLAEIFPGLREFSGGEALLVEAEFSSAGLFSRPYVESVRPAWGAYHGGDVYRWPARPYFAHVLGGEINPFAVAQDSDFRTIVNVLHSHEGHEEQVMVAARLYDAQGNCVVDRPGHRLALRKGLARFDLAELLPEPEQPFRGHLALAFAPRHGEPVPWHLQALVEFRTAASVARVMTWSDQWNSRVRLAQRARAVEPTVFRSWFRVLPGDCVSDFAIVNPGHERGGSLAAVRARLLAPGGALAECSLRIPAFATHWSTLAELFGDEAAAAAARSGGALVLESENDLASIGFTRDARSGAVSAEHFLWLRSPGADGLVWPQGS